MGVWGRMGLRKQGVGLAVRGEKGGAGTSEVSFFKED